MSTDVNNNKLVLTFCFGTSCFLRGAQELYSELMNYVIERGIADQTEFRVSFCSEQCDRGPVLTVGRTVLERCTVAMAAEEIEEYLETENITGGVRNA